jgi:glycosyltransferase involved in cell wall biosynthesis
VMVAANKGYPDRKAFQVQLRAWAEWAKDKPGALLYIHTEPTTMYGGLDFAALVRALGIEHKTLFPDRYAYFKGLPAEMMALLYNAADVYLGASMSEGFGIPLIEAQACGLPVVTTDFSAMPELVRWGYAVKPADMVWTPLNSWQAWPDVKGIQAALDSLYEEWDADGRCWDPAQRLHVQERIHKEYSWDAIARDNWRPLLETLSVMAPEVRPQKVAA